MTRWNVLALPCAVIAALSLSACAKVASEAPIPAPVEYSAEQQVRAANELDALPDGSALAQMMADYAVLRAKLRSARDQ